MSAKTQLGMLLLAFLLPVLAAWLVLDNHWYREAATNRGELLDPVITLPPQSKKWRLVYTLPDDCQAPCQEALWQIRQLHTALGAKRERVLAQQLVAEPTARSLGDLPLRVQPQDYRKLEQG